MEQATAAKTSDKGDKALAKKAAHDWTKEVELVGIRMPANVVLGMGQSSVMVGNAFSNGMGISGIVEKVVLMPNGAIRLDVRVNFGIDPNRGGVLDTTKGETKHCLVWPSGASAEVL